MIRNPASVSCWEIVLESTSEVHAIIVGIRMLAGGSGYNILDFHAALRITYNHRLLDPTEVNLYCQQHVFPTTVLSDTHTTVCHNDIRYMANKRHVQDWYCGHRNRAKLGGGGTTFPVTVLLTGQMRLNLMHVLRVPGCCTSIL